MKNLLVTVSLLLCFTVCAQDKIASKKIFVRVYNLEGKKFDKGKIEVITDSLLVLKRGENVNKIYFNQIGSIRTKRSVGNNFLVGAGSGVLVGTLLGVMNPPTETSGGTFTWAGSSSGEELSEGLMVGTFLGTAVGGITALFKNSKKYTIDADVEKLKVFKEIMLSD